MKVKIFFFSLSFESYYFFWNPLLFSDIKATAIEPCAKEENAAQCVLLGATCSKDLSFGFFSCRCQFPMVPSPKGCVSILEQELLATKDYQLEISGVEWSDSLSTITSIESLLLIEKITTWVIQFLYLNVYFQAISISLNSSINTRMKRDDRYTKDEQKLSRT